MENKYVLRALGDLLIYLSSDPEEKPSASTKWAFHDLDRWMREQRNAGVWA